MSVYEDRKQELEKYEFMMGVPRGRLAVTMDALAGALVLVGQHGVYGQSTRQPGKPAMGSADHPQVPERLERADPLGDGRAGK